MKGIIQKYSKILFFPDLTKSDFSSDKSRLSTEVKLAFIVLKSPNYCMKMICSQLLAKSAFSLSFPLPPSLGYSLTP